MHTYRLTISYDGTNYRGWQRQHNTDRTVQHIVESALSKVVEMPVRISGSGRTDSGVHAAGQEASVVLPKSINEDSVLQKMNAFLAEDIRILKIQEMKGYFHARKSACAKCYEYYVDLREKPDVFTRKYAFHFPHKINPEAMQRAAEVLKGEHDFSSFTDLKDSDDTVRTIYAIEITQTDEKLKMSFYGDGFLYHMVRILTGTLLDVGTGKIRYDEIGAILAAKGRKWSGFPAPAKGLFLKQVYYDMKEMPVAAFDGKESAKVSIF